MLDRTVAPEFGAVTYPDLLEPEYHLLSNKTKLFVLNAGEQPAIKFEIVLKGSIWQEKTHGASWFTAKMLAEGTQYKSSNKIASIFDFHGAQLEINPGFDNTSISLYCLKKHFKTTLSLLYEIVGSPIFPEKDLNTLINIRRQQIRLNNEKNSFLASRNIRKALYGDHHPYGRSLVENDLENITVQVLKDQYKNGFIGMPELFLSGSVGSQEVKIVEEIFGSVPFEANNNLATRFTSHQSENVSIQKPNSLQSAIKFGWHIPPKKHKDHFKLLITNEILGGYFGSRLMKNLREERGLTYGISSYPVFLKEESFLIIGAEVIADQTNLAIDEILKEIDLLKSNEVGKDELHTVTNYMSGSFLSKISTPFHLMDKFKSIHDHGLGYDYFKQYFEALQTITPKDIIETSSQYFNAQKMSLSIAGKYN